MFAQWPRTLLPCCCTCWASVAQFSGDRLLSPPLNLSAAPPPPNGPSPPPQLTVANTAFILEPGLNPGLEAQAAARIYRLGQDKPTRVVRFLAEETVEAQVGGGDHWAGEGPLRG